jgi:DNA-binding transcriptional MerR regulator
MERFIAAKLAGLSSGQLRSLEREGQVKPVVRTLGGCPLYALSQVEDIRKADVEARELEAYAA